MAQSYLELNEQVHKQMQRLAKESPDVMESFMNLHKTSGKDGALSSKTKELIALGIGISQRCDGCIAFHVHDAIEAGAEREEIVETIGVSILMGGGPSVVYGCKALQALNEMEEKKEVTSEGC
jgi:AhpD family alkylhydroperoxidase